MELFEPSAQQFLSEEQEENRLPFRGSSTTTIQRVGTAGYGKPICLAPLTKVTRKIIEINYHSSAILSNFEYAY